MTRWWYLAAVLLIGQGDDSRQLIPVPLNGTGGVNLAEVVNRLAAATSSKVEPLSAVVELPTQGRSRALTIQYLSDALKPAVRVELTADSVLFSIGPDPANAPGSLEWEQRLSNLAVKTRSEATRRAKYGFRARPSYLANDPKRPTVCLVHGLNSTSAVFKHLAPALEAAGYGVVTHDFPYNRDMDETSIDFGRDLARFRQDRGELARWILMAHSMGSLLARSYVEGGKDDEPSDVAALILIAPPNHGSNLALGQTLMQTAQTLQSVRGERRTDPLAYLGDGLGAAADDLTPGSAYLKALNARPRRLGVAYHILAGDSAYLSLDARRQVEARLAQGGTVGGLGRMLAAGMKGPLDEITDGLGDGCVAVASARLDGVADCRVIHANHLELIRAPLAFPDPGPIASLPILLDWLKQVSDAKLPGG